MTHKPIPQGHLNVLDAATSLVGRALAGPLDVYCPGRPGLTRRDCANQVIGEGLRLDAYFSREPASESEIARTRTTDHAGDRPAPALHRTAAGLRKRLAKAPDAEAVVHHPSAELPVRDVLALRVVDLLVHAHDLTPELWEAPEVEHLATWALEHGRDVVELMRSLGEFPDARRVTLGADSRTRLLALTGRGASPEPDGADGTDGAGTPASGA